MIKVRIRVDIKIGLSLGSIGCLYGQIKLLRLELILFLTRFKRRITIEKSCNTTS